jgi:hypothetical protein
VHNEMSHTHTHTHTHAHDTRHTYKRCAAHYRDGHIFLRKIIRYESKHYAWRHRNQLGSRCIEAFELVRAFLRNAFGQHTIMISSNSKQLALDTTKLLTNTTHAH